MIEIDSDAVLVFPVYMHGTAYSLLEALYSDATDDHEAVVVLAARKDEALGLVHRDNARARIGGIRLAIRTLRDAERQLSERADPDERGLLVSVRDTLDHANRMLKDACSLIAEAWGDGVVL